MRRKAKGLICLRMVDLWCQKWNLLLLFCLIGLLQWDLCSGQRLVQIQEGPLYRVKGYPIFISCNVSGFKGSPLQDFQFILKKGNIDINMISTFDTDFPYRMYSDRVTNKDIEIQRLSGSSVLLRINDLMEEDAGDLFCETLNTDGSYFGSYAAETKLNVIADTLEASYSGSPSQSLSEGDPLQLECQVFSQTFQHTHLSVTWFLHGEEDENPRPVITLDKDLTVKPGAGFEDRYGSGLISMDKVEDTTYRLKMSQVQQSDQGKFFCKAIEWIQDPDRSWTQIAYKTTPACDVEIKLLVAPDVGSFSVNLKVSKGPLKEGDTLDIRCSVNAQNLPGHFFSVTWLKNQQKVAQIGSSGVLTVSDSYKERENAAEMKAVKTSQMDYLLTIRSARTEDQGQYQCEVWQENMNEDGIFTKIQKKMSSPETVSITAKESDLAVLMVMNDMVTEGDALRVTCSVTGFKGPLSVSWQHKKDSGVSFSDVISLTHEGVMKDVGARYQRRNIQTLHSPAGNFTLEIGAAATSDSGEYKCIVSEWTVQSNGEIKKANTQSQEKAIPVNSVESLMRMSLKSRTTNVPIDSPVELLCTVRGPKASLAVRWMFQPHNSTVQTNILSIRHTGEMTWTADQRNYQLSIQAQPTETRFILMIPRVSKKQEGQYQCQVDAYQNDVQKAEKISNSLAVTVQKPVSKMRLNPPTPHLETTVNTDAKLECSVTKTTTNTSRFTITWSFGSQMLLTMDLDAVVKFGPAAGLEMDQRIRMDIREKQSFQLNIQQTRTSDSGKYDCEVEEWLQDPVGDWYSLKKMSVSTELVVKQEASDFKMNKASTQLTVEEGKQLKLKCSVDGIVSDSTFRYSLNWVFDRYQSSSVPLLTYSHDGRLNYNSYDSELERRLHFFTPELGIFYLNIHRAIEEDTGRYYCQVQQYQLDCKGKWSLKASDKSGFTSVTVQLTESKLLVHKEEKSLKAILHAGFTIDCVIESRSSDASLFEVTWSKAQRGEPPVIIFNASRDGTLQSTINDKDLVFGHPKAMHYKLTVPNVNPTDTGLYHCQVVEWIQTAANKWRRLGEDKSGVLSVQVETEEGQKNGSFAMVKNAKDLVIKEGEQFDLECSLDVENENPTYQYSLRWVFNRPESTSGIPLLSYSHDGRLQYNTEYQDRLRFSRPSSGTFRLERLNSNIADSGSYQCRVVQYQLDCEGQWKQMAEDKSGSTIVTVRNIESKLHVQKENRMLNITKHQAEFTIDCVIDSQTSDKPFFEVTWFKVQEKEEPVTMFTAKHDGTLHTAISEKNLLFGRPLATHYKLTVPQISPSDMGKYYCQVEEWLLTDNTWMKLGSDRSGELSIYVQTEGLSEKTTDPLVPALWVTVPLICFLVLVIVLLLKRDQKRNSELKKKKDCLWAENNPLSPMPEVEEDCS
ncbi:immunoglobulin superfamily member 2-like isoform X2 [Puntigrus tetrazona]|uniref:immunoglobulin superfamily member 2-like isoform X2 n=1 Tax=Puntigrus tetrazona TaxID=1606681 RepID=UPI001C8AAA60|nr:immunoglobulin superfamily member 2-like isoform X2 [Puntigrus tetrazona]